MKKTITLFFLFFAFSRTIAQQNDTQAWLYNIGLGSITGGIGAVINKKNDEKTGRVFVKGLWQGAIGGYVIFESKRLIGLVPQHKELGYSWPSKIVNAAGVSIVENAAANRDFWKRWHMDYGFNRIEVHIEDRVSLHYKVMPVALVFTVGIAAQTKFELRKTLQTGQFIFSSNTKRWEETNSDGITLPGNIIYKPGAPAFYNLMAHEVIHIYQSNDIKGLNAYLDKPYAGLAKKSNFYKNIDKWVYFDINHGLQAGLYNLQNVNRFFYYDNYYEHEAGYYSANLQDNLPYNP